MVSKSLASILAAVMVFAALPLHAEKPIPVKRIIDRYHQIYHNGGGITQPLWLGIPTGQTPNDQWVMQEIFTTLRPGYVIETGTGEGGSALYYASLFGMIKPSARILTMDVERGAKEARLKPAWKARVRTHTGSSVQPAALRAAANRRSGKTLVILGENSSREHVLRELELYARFVSVGSYLIVRNANVHGFPVEPEHGDGPYEAIQEFLRAHPEFGVDDIGVRFIHSGRRNAYLKKTIKSSSWGKNPTVDFARAQRLVKAVRINGLNEMDRVTTALQSGPEIVRWYAADLLGDMPGERTVPALLRTLSDTSVDVRRRALESLLRLKDPAAVDAVMRLVGDRKLGPNAARVIQAIGVPARSQVQTLIDVAVDTEKDAYWRAKSAEAVGFVGKSVHVRDIVPILKKNTSDEYLRSRICVALGHIGGPGGVSALMVGLREGSDRTVYQCAIALGQQKYKLSVGSLQTILRDRERYLARIGAAKALAMIGSPRSGLILAEVARDMQSEPAIREASLRGLTDIGKTRLKTHRAALEDEDFRVRVAAADGLGRHRDKKSLDALEAATGDDHAAVRVAAIRAIGAIGGASARKILKAVAEKSTGLVQVAAMKELNR